LAESINRKGIKMSTDEEIQIRYATMSNARLEGETFEEYKERRKQTNKFIKNYLKGIRIK